MKNKERIAELERRVRGLEFDNEVLKGKVEWLTANLMRLETKTSPWYCTDAQDTNVYKEGKE